MYIRGLIPRTFAELDEAVPIVKSHVSVRSNSRKALQSPKQSVFRPCITTSNWKFHNYNRDKYAILLLPHSSEYKTVSEKNYRSVYASICMCTYFTIFSVASSIQARSHTFVEIDHEIISTVILLPSAGSFKKGCCQLQAKVCAQITG